MRHVKETLEYEVLFHSTSNQTNMDQVGFSNVEWCKDKQGMKITLDNMFNFQDAQVSWCSKNNLVVTLSFL